MRIIFMGTPEFSVPVLEELIKNGHDIAAVVTQPDKPKGRGKAMAFPPVKECALKYGLTVLQPEKVKDPQVIDQLRSYEPELIAVVAFGQFLPKAILNMPKYGCINVHASLLPKYRGAGPIQWAVINGEKESGVTTMFMSSGIDKGDMLLKSVITLDPHETGDSLHDRLSVLGGPLLIKTIDELEKGTAVRIPQDDSQSSYAPMLDKAMGIIDWNKDAQVIERLIRGLNSWPGTVTKITGKNVKIWDAEVVDDNRGTPGEVIEADRGSLIVRTGNLSLSLKEVQPEGKKRMAIDAFLRGYPVEKGSILGK